MIKSSYSKVNTLFLNKDHLEMWPIIIKVIQIYLTKKKKCLNIVNTNSRVNLYL